MSEKYVFFVGTEPLLYQFNTVDLVDSPTCARGGELQFLVFRRFYCRGVRNESAKFGVLAFLGRPVWCPQPPGRLAVCLSSLKKTIALDDFIKTTGKPMNRALLSVFGATHSFHANVLIEFSFTSCETAKKELTFLTFKHPVPS